MNDVKAVIFDLGGVVISSPMKAFFDAEIRMGLAPNFLNKVIVSNGEKSAWAKLERGELSMDQVFFTAFDKEISDAGAPGLNSKAVMQDMASSATVNKCMITAIEKLKKNGFKVAALTNNWRDPQTDGFAKPLKDHFNILVESAAEGMQKPDPRIYQICCQRLGISPADAIFLDDIGRNVKAARALGMQTIKVSDPVRALKELEILVGMSLFN
jgi:epoxide hydrolase-like predicted phosphatase